MTRYVCNHCTVEAFTEIEAGIDRVFNPDSGHTHNYLTCPGCGLGSISEAFECDQCGDYTSGIATGTDSCIECATRQPDLEQRSVACCQS